MATATARTASKGYFGALVVAQAAALIRYVVLARLLGPEQLGLAVIIVLTVQFFDSITDAGADRFLVQDRESDSRAALHLVQLVGVAKGVSIALLLLVLAGPIAHFSGAPSLEAPLRVLAIVPLVTGFTSFEFRLAQRHHDFRPEAWIRFISEVAGLLATVAAAFIVRDFTAILYGLTARALAAVVVSNAVADERFRVRYSSALAQRLWRFGAPLMLSGLVYFFASQSDRYVIAKSLGLAFVGQYSAVFLLIMYPSALVQRFLSNTFLPRLVNIDDKLPQEKLLQGMTVCLAAAGMIGFALVGPFVIPFLYGSAFRTDATTIALIAVLQAVRFLRLWPTVESLGLGRTHIVLIGNVLRCVGLPAAIVAVTFYPLLSVIVASYIVGEFVALFVALHAVNRVADRPRTFGLFDCSTFLALSVMVITAAETSGRFALAEVVTGLGAFVLTLVLLVRNFQSVRQFLSPQGGRAHSSSNS